jgi:SAM-dependent methyltransferase
LSTEDQMGFPAALAHRYFRHFGEARTILDVGCGSGSFGRHAPPGVRIHGIDRDESALALAALHEDVVTRVDLAREALPFEDATFDGVLAKDVLEHLPDPLSLVRELHRVLVPSGGLVASVVVANPRRVWDDYTHVRGFTRTAARQLLGDGGFRVEAISRMGPVPGSLRFGFVGQIPVLLRVPGVGRLWTASWELYAHRAP